MTGAGKTSATVTAMPASHGAAAIEARVREMVLVTKASGSPASRNHHSAAAYWSQAAAGPPPAIGCPPWERPLSRQRVPAAAPALARPRTR